jgi:hypothetical protein
VAVELLSAPESSELWRCYEPSPAWYSE